MGRTVSWIHIGDTHLTRSGEQSDIDLGRIVDEINAVYAKDDVEWGERGILGTQLGPNKNGRKW
jgi:hypothetical protein